MPHAAVLDAIVLASYDVGEADRFLILLTREKGRLAARAPGARRLKSRLCPLLPLTHLTVELKEGRGGFLVCGIVPHHPHNPRTQHLQDFLVRMQASELLLALLSDGEPVPEIFEALSSLLHHPHCAEQDTLAFALRTLALLGVLPDIHASLFSTLSPEERAFVVSSTHGLPRETEPPSLRRLRALCDRLVGEQITRPLRSPDVTAACAGL